MLAYIAADSSWLATIQSATIGDLTYLGVARDGVLAVSTPVLTAAGASSGAATTVDTDVVSVGPYSVDGTFLVYEVDHAHTGGDATPMAYRKSGEKIALLDVATYEITSQGHYIYLSESDSQKVDVVFLDDCTTTGCKPLSLGASARILTTTADGSRLTFAVLDGDENSDLYYFDYKVGAPQFLAHIGELPLPANPLRDLMASVSSDGSRVAFVTPAGAIQVLSTSDMSPVPWAQIPAGLTPLDVVLADATTLGVRATATNSSCFFAGTASSMVELVAATSFAFPATKGAAPAFAFTAVGVNISAVQLSTGKAVALGMSAYTYPTLSDDGSLAYMKFDQGSATTFGTLEVIDLASLFSASGPKITALGGPSGGAAFNPGTNELVYFDSNENLDVWDATAGTRTILKGDKTASFEGAGAGHVYVDLYKNDKAAGSSGQEIDVITL